MKWTHIEPISLLQLAALTRTLPRMSAALLDLGNIDVKLGRGVGPGNDRCLWTKTGHRIDICVSSDGGVIASQTKDPDPGRPPHKPTAQQFGTAAVELRKAAKIMRKRGERFSKDTRTVCRWIEAIGQCPTEPQQGPKVCPSPSKLK